MVENDGNQKELIRQDAVPIIVKCATDSEFDASTVQQPSLECLWTMVFVPEAFEILSQSVKFLAHLKKLAEVFSNNPKRTSDDNNEDLSEQLKDIAEHLLWKLVEEPALLAKKQPTTTTTTNFKYDIMISYQRTDENICKQIYERLTKIDGFRVWLDLKDLHGRIMDTMA